MKKFLMIFAALCIVQSSLGQEITLTNFRAQLLPFLVSIGFDNQAYNVQYPNLIVKNIMTNENILTDTLKSEDIGLYSFRRVSSLNVKHLLLIHNDRGLIINMCQPFKQSVQTILDNTDNYGLNRHKLMLILNKLSEISLWNYERADKKTYEDKDLVITK